MSNKIASFDVDAQQGFTPLCPDELPVHDGDKIVDALNLMASKASVRVGSKDAHYPSAPWVVATHDEMLQPTGIPNADMTWVSHCVPGTQGFELLDGLPQPIDYDYFIWKGIEGSLHPYGACYHDIGEKMHTGIIHFLKAEGVSTVIVGGLAFDYCVKTTALQLKQAGFNVVIYAPATRAISGAGSLSATKELITAGVFIADNENHLINAIKG